MDDNRAMPFRPALPMNRANLRCLGLSVGIAIALSGCAKGYPSANGYWHDLIHGNPLKAKGRCA